MPSGHLGQGCWVLGLLQLWRWACCAHAVVWPGEQARRALQRTEFVHALYVLGWQATHRGWQLGAHWAHHGISDVFKAWGHEKAHPANLTGSSAASTSNCPRNTSNTAQFLSCFLVCTSAWRSSREQFSRNRHNVLSRVPQSCLLSVCCSAIRERREEKSFKNMSSQTNIF